MPKVSVIIPSYNSEKVVPLTIASALEQTFTDMEVIVVDDGSTDGTRQALARFGNRIRYIYQENKKHSGARNTGIKAAQGEYLAFLDSDDLWLPQKIERQVEILNQHPDVVLVCCVAEYIDQLGNPARSSGISIERHAGVDEEPSTWTSRLFLGDAVPGGGSSAMVRRSALIQAGMFDEGLDYAEDWDTWMRLSFLGKFVLIPDHLILFRVSGWERILRREASNELISRPIRLIEKASALWNGDPKELEELRARGNATLWQRAALASFQLGLVDQGREQFSRMLSIYPSWKTEQSCLDLGIDRAWLIFKEYEDFDRALQYLNVYFNGLPQEFKSHRQLHQQAVAWLWYGRMKDEISVGDLRKARGYWLQSVRSDSRMLGNRGILLAGFEVFLGKKIFSFIQTLLGKRHA